MWVAKIKLQHDCIIGNRCREFNVTMQSLDLNEEKDGKKFFTSSIHQLLGERKNINKLVKDLRKDKRTKYVEVNGDSLFLIETSKNKPVSRFNRKMFFVKPVIIDTQGYEYWEIASHKRGELIKFMSQVEPLVTEFELLNLKDTSLQSIYFPKVMPRLTALQKKALELAINQGYYEAPKGTDLRSLARKMGVSLATYQRHLQKAESKIIPDVLSYIR